MTLDQIRHRIDDIRQVKEDDEVAHAKEDALRGDVLSAISEGDFKTMAEVQEAAGMACFTSTIHFCRWYA